MIYTVTLNPAIDYVIYVDQFSEGQLNKTKKEYKFPGGKGINVARVLQELNTPALNLGFVGGFTGSFIKSELNQHGLAHDFIEVSEDTRINIKLKSDEETEINGLGPVVTEVQLSELYDQVKTLSKRDMLVLSGSIPQGVPKDIYITLAKQAFQQDVPFVVDISDDSLWDILAYQPVLIKPNEHELAELFKTQWTSIQDIYPYGKKLVDKGAQHVIVSLGSKGALLFYEDQCFKAEPLSGRLINSVGAGDSVVAGFISGISQGMDAVDAFKLGVACGSATAFSADLASKESIDFYYENVVIHEVN